VYGSKETTKYAQSLVFERAKNMVHEWRTARLVHQQQHKAQNTTTTTTRWTKTKEGRYKYNIDASF